MRRLVTLAAAITLLTAAPASAETFTVTSTNDGGACAGTSCQSIRAALAAAASPAFPGTDAIVVPAGVHQLVDQIGVDDVLAVNSPVALVGAGARVTSVVGSGVGRVFSIGPVAATISGLQIRGGDATNTDLGGNVYNLGGNVTLDHVRVTAGVAGQGGGVANESGTLVVQSSLIDGNDLTGSDDSDQDGGGILNVAGNGPAALTVRDSTIVGNVAASGGGGGISSRGGTATATLERVTVARNRTPAGAGGLAFVGGGSFTVRASILDDNLTTPAATAAFESNCGTPVPVSGGGNVVGTRDCGFVAAGDVLDANPLLSASLTNAGGQTDVLTIPANSVAVDRVPGCVALDQRDAARPQGPACDSGAFEYNPEPDTSLSTTISSSGRTRTFTFGSSEAGTSFQCRLDGPSGTGAFVACFSPTSFTNLAGGRYTFYVRAVDSLGAPDPTPAATTFQVPPNAVAGQRVVVKEIRGRVRVKRPGGKYVNLNNLTEIPDGSLVDTRNGVVRLSFQPKAGGKLQTAKFWDGIFKVDQRKKIMELALVEKLAKCAQQGNATTAARRKKSRRLWGDGKGRFRTKGQYSSATVRGTRWLTQDSCAGTLTRVRKGKVNVRDFVRKRTIRLKKGQQYLARPG